MMSAPPKLPQKRDWLLLATGLFLLLVFCLGSRGLNEPDEGRYANIARAMATSGDWWEPRMSGFGHYDKPPLVYWATAASLKVFGMNEWAARLPSLLGAMLALLGLGWASWRLRGPRAAWWAVLIGGTSVQFYVLGRILSPDMLLTGWCTLAVAAWAECRHRGGAWRWWLACLGFWTLAWWTKATPALIPLAGLLAGVVATGDTAGRKALRIWLLFPSILVLGAAWFLSMMSHYPELKQFFLGRELAGRMAGRVDGRHGSKLYYLPISAAAWLPWWPLAVWCGWKRRAELRSVPGTSTARAWGVRLGIEGWIVLTGLLIFSLAASKLPTYTLTLAPWAALGMARLICRLPAPAAQKTAFHLPAALLAGGFATAMIAGVLIIPRREAALGVNSSLRAICNYLQKRGAHRVHADQYWPGMEFYLGDDAVRYVAENKHQRERSSDPGVPPARFIDPRAWSALETAVEPPGSPARDLWLVHFRKRRHSPFGALLSQALEQHTTKTIGQFDLIHVGGRGDGTLDVLPLTR